jgi:hypothetical protein
VLLLGESPYTPTPSASLHQVLVLLGDLVHEHLAAAAARAAGRPHYDGLSHDVRPPQPLWRVDQGQRTLTLTLTLALNLTLALTRCARRSRFGGWTRAGAAALYARR